MDQEDEEKTAFYTDQGTFCYTKMSFGLKNVGATYQRLVDTAFESQIGRNLEAYVDDMVIKIKTEKEMIADVAETFDNLRHQGQSVQEKGHRRNAITTYVEPDAKPVRKENKDDYRWAKEAETAFQELKKAILSLPFLTIPLPKETLYIYLAASKEAVSAVLLATRKGKQCPVHYVSRTLHEAEQNYAPLEKLALTFGHVSRRLRRYFKAHPIKVVIDQPLRQILDKAEAFSKLAKYSIKLGAYNIEYQSLSGVKG
ncbi:reverse transcriptase domain-containing protein [Tanacetum coccineum]